MDFSQVKAKGKEPESGISREIFQFLGRLLSCRFSGVTELASFSTGAVPRIFT